MRALALLALFSHLAPRAVSVHVAALELAPVQGLRHFALSHTRAESLHVPLDEGVSLALGDATISVARGGGARALLATCMDELYIASRRPVPLGSDATFETTHVDGPFGPLAPLCRVRRCLLGLVVRGSPITTHFPLGAVVDYTIGEGQMLCFDYNLDHHYISGNMSSAFRAVIKTHLALSPLGALLPYCASAHCEYNRRTRELFNASIDEGRGSLARRLRTLVTRAGTGLALLDLHVGLLDVALIAALALRAARRAPDASSAAVRFLALLSPIYGAFLCVTLLFGTSGGLSARAFARSARALKLAQVTATALALRTAPLHLKATAATGLALASWAYSTLGDEGTYYGTELGAASVSISTGGPYAVIPHPMLVGALLPLLCVFVRASRTEERWALCGLVTSAALLVVAVLLERPFGSRGNRFENLEAFYVEAFSPSHRSSANVLAHLVAIALFAGALRRLLGSRVSFAAETGYALLLRSAGADATSAALSLVGLHLAPKPQTVRAAVASLLLAPAIQDVAHWLTAEGALAYEDHCRDAWRVAQLSLFLPVLLARRLQD